MFGLPRGLIHSRGNQSVPLMVHLLPVVWRRVLPIDVSTFDAFCDICHSCLLPDPGVMLSVSKCYAQHNPLHFPLCHPECIPLGGGQCQCLAAIGHYRGHIFIENLPPDFMPASRLRMIPSPLQPYNARSHCDSYHSNMASCTVLTCRHAAWPGLSKLP